MFNVLTVSDSEQKKEDGEERLSGITNLQS